MITYKDDPNLGIKIVTTATGEKEYRRNCKLIKGSFYIKGVDCIEIDGNWYRKDSPSIAFDHETKYWVLRNNFNKVLIEGIVSFDKDNPVIGYFSDNPYNNVLCYDTNGRKLHCINFQLLLENNYIEDLGTGYWYLKKTLSSTSIRQLLTIRNEKNYQNKGYNIEDNHIEFDQKIKAFNNYPIDLTKDVRKFAKFLGNTTFGAEVELSEGSIPDHIQNRMGIVMCRDGSITGGEAVTVPMQGAKGLQNLSNIGSEFKRRANIDINCSFHLHLGNIPKDRSYLVSLYILGLKVQDDIFRMFPYYKTEPKGIKKKNYCQKLKKMSIYPLKDTSKEGYKQYIDDVYAKIFTFLSDGVPPNQLNNRKQLHHPIPQKWNRPSRYYWLNLQNMIFSQRFTAEFRLHQGTLNSQKMVNWLFICQAISKYAEKYQNEIITGAGKITLPQILKYYTDHFKENKLSGFLTEYLTAYYNERCALYKTYYDAGDYVCENDAKRDKEYVFKHGNVSFLF